MKHSKKKLTGYLAVACLAMAGTFMATTVALSDPDTTIPAGKKPSSLLPPTPGTFSEKSGLELDWFTPNPDADGKPEPKDLYIYVLDFKLGKDVKLPALKVKLTDDGSESSPETAATCGWTPDRGDCVTCPDDDFDYILDKDKIASMKGVKVVKAKSEEGIAHVDGLKKGKYVVFMQYAPKGTQTSSCVISYAY